MLCAVGASFVFQRLTRTLVGNNWVVLGMVVGVLDSRMDSVLDPLCYRSTYVPSCSSWTRHLDTSRAFHEAPWAGNRVQNDPLASSRDSKWQIPRAVGKHPTTHASF